MVDSLDTQFPYEEIRAADGDYFPSQHAARMAGYLDNQIWSIAVVDDTWTFGPSHHWVNVIGYIATNETHDNKTYFDETITVDKE